MWEQGTIEFWVKPTWNPSSQNQGTYIFFDVQNMLTIGRSWNDQTAPYSNGYIYFTTRRFDGQDCNYGFWEVNSADSTALKREPTVSQSWRPDTWHYIAATWDHRGPSQISLYIDGDRIGTKSISYICYNFPPETFAVGSFADGTYQANSVVDELRISNAQRSPVEIMSNYALGLAAQGQYCSYNNGQIVRPPDTCIQQNVLSYYCNADAQIVQNCNACGGCGGATYCDTNSGMCKTRSKPRPIMSA